MIAPPAQHVRRAVQAALAEDLALGDATTAALFPAPIAARGAIVAHESMTVAGLAVAREVFHQVDDTLRLRKMVEDGACVNAGTVVLQVEGDGRSILMGERVALNFLQHLSGVATLTARFCKAVRGYGTRILDTRKTLPGLRALEKWAVRLGGGRNHRGSLGDGILIKDNHLALLRARRVDLTRACRLARDRGPQGQRIIVEAASPADVKQALAGEADVILLDNMSPQVVRACVELIKGRAMIEVSGGITLDNVTEMAAAGAGAISIGALTHSAPAANLSLDVQAGEPRNSRRARRQR